MTNAEEVKRHDSSVEIEARGTVCCTRETHFKEGESPTADELGEAMALAERCRHGHSYWASLSRLQNGQGWFLEFISFSGEGLDFVEKGREQDTARVQSSVAD